jgi:uncharacterized protein YecA (UPF0149 family)
MAEGGAEVIDSAPLDESSSGDADEQKALPFKRFGDKIGRNDPCPCGSGKKFKKCCGGPTSLH